MQSKHSLEKTAAHQADAFTTVSEVTARECRQLLEINPYVTPNAFEQNFVPKGEKYNSARKAAREKMLAVASCLLGEKFSDDTLIVATSGRNEFRNKGLDAFIDAMNVVRNDLRNSTWNGTLSIDGDNTNMCAERWNTTFDVYQTINLPNGLYKVEVQGFYRNGGYADAAAKHVDGSEQLLAAVYANTAETPLQSIFTEAGKVDAGVTTDGIDGKFPNSMKDASAFFSASSTDFPAYRLQPISVTVLPFVRNF